MAKVVEARRESSRAASTTKSKAVDAKAQEETKTADVKQESGPSEQLNYKKVHAYRIKPLKPKGHLAIDGEPFPFKEFTVEVHKEMGCFLSLYGCYEAPFGARNEKESKAKEKEKEVKKQNEGRKEKEGKKLKEKQEGKEKKENDLKDASKEPKDAKVETTEPKAAETVKQVPSS
ncbi:hypothetical protein CVT24_009225 [Panaeolus cyanescens]|uniref:Uncharacterized protein n=1 Tax=Panaeolus cyanescens TaxID=181874 RepID=A0A409Y8I4_9AGAR|nr:hypothetical protein CVT24_009225 [Panaeolus cyanescens]